MLRELSLFWCMAHTIVLFFLLFESRLSVRKTIIITASTMIPLTIVNLFLAFSLDAERMGLVMLLTLSLPSLAVFWPMAKYRDGRFFFTFCFVDTMVLVFIFFTQILNFYTTPDTDIAMFISRLLLCPLLEWITIKTLRKPYLEVQHYTHSGWTIFAVISALFYVLLVLMFNFPTTITERPEYLPAALLLLILIPFLYTHMITTLRRQQKLHEMVEQENILSLQVSNLTARIGELAAADEKFRMERHNFRHKMKTIASLLDAQQYAECRTLLDEYNEALERTRAKRYCQHTVIDAVLSTYIQRAESKNIKVTFGFAFPDQIPVNETELATAIANALENAINACEGLEIEQRYIEIKVLNHPRFIIQIANSYDGEVIFDDHGIPVNAHEDHGFGTRFIAAFCHKHDGFYQFKADGKRFVLYLNF